MKLALKINGQWAILPPDTSISIVSTSPLFGSEKGDISYPFELDIHENSHIFHNLADTHGYVRLADYHRLPAEIWYDGMQLFVGQTEVDDTVEFDGDTISINIISAGKSFADAIDGMNCRDVPLKDDEILLGTVPVVDKDYPLSLKVEGNVSIGPFSTASDAQAAANQFNSIRREGKQILVASVFAKTVNVGVMSGGYMENVTFDAPRFLVPRNGNINTYNIRHPYPTMPFCNVKICQPNGEKAADGAEGSGYSVTDVSDVNSAPSFFLLYFIECLFRHIDMSCDISALTAIEDMCRIVMFNAFPRYRLGDTVVYKADLDTSDDYTFQSDGHKYRFLSVRRKRKISFSYDGIRSKEKENAWSTPLAYAVNGLRHAYATSDNFPDVEVSKVIESMENAFGVIFDCDASSNEARLLLKRDIMRGTDIVDVGCTITTEHITRKISGGVRLTYGVDDDVLYHYDTTEETVAKLGYEAYSNYNEIVSSDRSAFDTATKYDLRTGNAYRIKVNEDTGLEPQLFAVADYNDVAYGKDKTGAVEPEEISVPFLPVTLNDIWGWRQAVAGESDARPSSSSDSEMAVFVPDESYGELSSVSSIDGKSKTTVPCSTAVVSNYALEFSTPDGKGSFRVSWDGQYSIYGPAARDLSDESEQYPLEKYDAGLQLGIFRGPGNISAGVSIIETDYDGEGNDSWGYFPARGGGISADSVDRWGSPYDYQTNASQSSLTDRISLLFDARKVQRYTDEGDPEFYPIVGDGSGLPSADMERRGLVPQFLEDYLYFLAHKTTISFEVDMSISDVMSLPYYSRVRIGTHVGFLYQKEYTIDDNGIHNIILTLYELNK